MSNNSELDKLNRDAEEANSIGYRFTKEFHRDNPFQAGFDDLTPEEYREDIKHYLKVHGLRGK